MAAPETFAGLRRLTRKLGIGRASADTTVPDEDDDDTSNQGDSDGSEGTDGNQDAGAGDTGEGGDQGQGDAGNADGGDGDEGGSSEGEDGGEGGEGGDTGAAADGNRSADYRAGVADTERRWAAVLVSEHARANLELATDLLATSNMAPADIIRTCQRNPSMTDINASASRHLRERTPKVSLGTGESTTPGASSAGDIRKKTVKARNEETARKAGRSGVATRKAGGGRRPAVKED